MLRVKTELEAQGRKVSLRKVPERLGVFWSTVHYKPRRRKPAAVDGEVEQAIYQLIQHYPRYGYRRITVLLRRRMGLIVNKKKVQRSMQRNGWAVNASEACGLSAAAKTAFRSSGPKPAQDLEQSPTMETGPLCWYGKSGVFQ